MRINRDPFLDIPKQKEIRPNVVISYLECECRWLAGMNWPVCASLLSCDDYLTLISIRQRTGEKDRHAAEFITSK